MPANLENSAVATRLEKVSCSRICILELVLCNGEMCPTKCQTGLKQSCANSCKIFLFLFLSFFLSFFFFFFFFQLWQLFCSKLTVKVEQLLGFQGPWQCQVCRVQEHRLTRPQELQPHQSFFELLVGGNQKASLASLSPQFHPFRQHLEGFLAWDPSLLFNVLAHRKTSLAGVLLCRLVHQALKGAS